MNSMVDSIVMTFHPTRNYWERPPGAETTENIYGDDLPNVASRHNRYECGQRLGLSRLRM